MPYTHYDNNKYYWMEQIDFAYSQYCGLSKENLQSWLDGKKHMSRSIMSYVRRQQRKREELKMYNIIVNNAKTMQCLTELKISLKNLRK